MTPPIPHHPQPHAPAPAGPPPDASATPHAWSDAAPEPEWPLAPAPLRRVDQHWLRHVNRALVLAALRQHGPSSRVGLAARTGLSRTTVGVIAAALLDEGVIREGERLPAAAQGGRRAVLLYVV